MEKTKAKILQLHPELKERRDEPKYTKADLKKVLFCFARDYERARDLTAWSSDKLHRFINKAFDSD